MYNKENVTTTPSKNIGGSVPETTPTPSKKTLRPISPNKQNTGGVGRLSFLQSDNIDDHFEHIHNSNEEIRQSLYDIETNTKQTSLDLGQLIDRSKNNNHHLNRVLESIAKYSEEVTTEGNATKSDVTEILKRLESFQTTETSKGVEELKAILERSQLSDLKPAISKISDDYKASNAKIIEELNQLSISLELQESSPQQQGMSVLLKELEMLKDSIKVQSENYKSLEARLDLQKTEKDLEDRNAQLENKYALLCESYKVKYQQYTHLEELYRTLETNVKQLTESLNSNDYKKSKNLQQLHSARLDALAPNATSESLGFPRKRVVSMPIKEQKEDKYSDSEEF